MQNASSRLSRWALWDLQVIHRKGKLHADADWLSRNVYEYALSESAESVEILLYSEERKARLNQIMTEQQEDEIYARIF